MRISGKLSVWILMFTFFLTSLGSGCHTYFLKSKRPTSEAPLYNGEKDSFYSMDNRDRENKDTKPKSETLNPIMTHRANEISRSLDGKFDSHTTELLY